MNYLWGGMIIVGVIYGALTGRLDAVTDQALASAKEAITLCITMAGVMAFWVGIMRIAERAGMVEQAARSLNPVMGFLFPNLPKDSPARTYIAMNMVANFLGLGWAATPAGLSAMKELEKLEEERRRNVPPEMSGEPRGKRKRRLRASGRAAVPRGVVFDYQHLLPAVDSGEYHRLPEPVRERESGGDCGTRDCGHSGEYGGGGGLL